MHDKSSASGAPPRFYLAAVQEPTSIISIETGSLQNRNSLNALVARTQSLEVCKIGHDGLRSIYAHKIFGSIVFCKMIKLPGEEIHSVFVLTEKFDAMILEYADTENCFKTRAFGNIADPSYAWVNQTKQSYIATRI